MPIRFINIYYQLSTIKIDLQIVVLNIASVGSIIATTISKNSTSWSVVFLIFTVGVLNLAKAYATVKESRRKKQQNK